LTPLVIVFLLWLKVFIVQITAGVSLRGSNWWNISGIPTFKNLALIPVKFMFGRISFDNKVLYFLIVTGAAVLFGFLLYKAFKAPKILWIWLVVPIILGILVSFIIPNLTYFRFLFCLTPFYLLVAFGTEKAGKLGKILFVLLIAFNILTTGCYLVNPKFQREDWRGLVHFVEPKKNGNSITIFPSGANMEAYRYYAPDAKIGGPKAIKAGYSQIWLLDYLGSVFDPTDTAKVNVEALGYRQEAEYSFNGVGNVYLYKK